MNQVINNTALCLPGYTNIFFECTVREVWYDVIFLVANVCSIFWFKSQEEEDWLDALEAGELDDFGRMKQEKDTSTMTARQVG